MNNCHLTTDIQSKTESSLSPIQHLARATADCPANLTMIVKQSYKPLHAKSRQFNQKTIAVTKGTLTHMFQFIRLSSINNRLKMIALLFDTDRERTRERGNVIIYINLCISI